MKTGLYILSGFLGSGKTTVLRSLLAGLKDAEGLLVLINEAGSIGLDGKLVERYGLPVREISGGCVCCSAVADLIGFFNAVFEAPEPPRRIIMEASGLADPVKLGRIVHRFKAHLNIVKTTLILDAELWEAREALGDFFNSQLAAADLVLLSKVDLYSPERALAMLAELAAEAPGVPVWPTLHGAVEPGLFFEAPAGLRKPAPPGGLSLGEKTGLAGYETFAWQSPDALSRARFEQFIESEGERYARIKGQALFAEGPLYFDYVRGHSVWRPPLEDMPGNALVFIGRSLDRPALAARLDALMEF